MAPCAAPTDLDAATAASLPNGGTAPLHGGSPWLSPAGHLPCSTLSNIRSVEPRNLPEAAPSTGGSDRQSTVYLMVPVVPGSPKTPTMWPQVQHLPG